MPSIGLFADDGFSALRLGKMKTKTAIAATATASNYGAATEDRTTSG